MENKVKLALKGAAMGIAEVIPGVSGGTIAFITGIYEDLINSIKAVGPEAWKGFRDDGLQGAFNAINGPFLLTLLLGMGIGFVAGVFGVTYLMDHYPEPLWGFFFGLIAASAVYMARQVQHWNIQKIMALILGGVIAYGITILSPAEGSTNPLYVFISGVIAISALLLPGISGSFILLLMGMYTIIIPTIKNFLKSLDLASLAIIGVFGLGCLVGLAGFSRILSWLFAKYKEVSFALLTGFLIGALNKVWPWRNVKEIMLKENGERLEVLDYMNFKSIDPESFKIIAESNVWFSEYGMSSPKTAATFVFLIIGFISVFILDRMGDTA